MLILSRKPGEAIFIGDTIQVVVLSVRGNQVRFGLTAPSDMPIDRQEIRERKQAEKISRVSSTR